MSDLAQSILPSEMRGVMTISGYRGIGKSFLAMQADNPANIAWFDFENKGRGINASAGFGLYRALTQEAAGKNPVSLFGIAMKAFAELEQDRFSVVVLDNISPLELAMKAEARRDAAGYSKRFGLVASNIVSGRFGGASAVVNYMVSSMISDVLHSRGVNLIIAISHISPKWAPSGPIPGKYHKKGADRWEELSILSLMLVPGDHPPVPSAIVSKEQLGFVQWDNEKREWNIRRRLPERLPKATFSEIRRYLAEGDFANMTQDEMSRVDEVEPFLDTLSKEQLSFVTESMRYEIVQRTKQEVDKTIESETLEKKARSLYSEGKSLEEIVAEVKGPLPLIKKWIGQN